MRGRRERREGEGQKWRGRREWRGRHAMEEGEEGGRGGGENGGGRERVRREGQASVMFT